MPNASAAPVRSLCRGRRLKESATSRIKMGLSMLPEREGRPIMAVRGSQKYFPQLVQPQTRVSVLLRHLFFRLRQCAHIHYQIAALNARGHTDRIAPANFANRRHIYCRPTVAANDILPILAIAFRAANAASIQSRSVSVRLLDDHEAQRLATHVNRKQMQVRSLHLA